MGGPGSGNRWRYGARSTTDDYRRIDVRHWAREGTLRPGYCGGWGWKHDGEAVASIQVRAEEGRVILTYRQRSGDDDWKDEQYPVLIEWTKCNLGGTRPWFICPALGCGRRVAILYGGGIFACQHCHQLAYQSTREDAGYRATRRADRLRERMCWEPGILNGEGPKPKWMRWRTFERLTAEHDGHVKPVDASHRSEARSCMAMTGRRSPHGSAIALSPQDSVTRRTCVRSPCSQ